MSQLARAFTLEPGRQALARGWLLLAVLALALSSLHALVLVGSRTPVLGTALGLESLFATALVLHVDLAIGVWFLAMGALLWTLARRGPAGRGERWSLGAAWTGAALLVLAPVIQPGPPLLSDYLPVLDSLMYLLALGLFGLAWLAVAVAAALARAAESGALLGRLAAWVALAAALVLAAGFAADSPGGWRGRYADLLWGPGHLLQTTHTLLLLLAWLWLAGLDDGTVRRAGRIRALAWAVAAPALLGAALLAWVEPGGELHRHGYTLVMALSGSLALAGAIWIGRGERLAAGALWTEPALGFSFALFAVGLALGFFIRGQDSLVPAHYHGAIGAVTLGFMGVCYRLVPALGGRRPGARSVRRQVWAYGCGMLLLIAGLVLAAIPRKVPGLEFAADGLARGVGFALMALGGAAALAASIRFALIVVRALRPARDAVGVPARREEA